MKMKTNRRRFLGFMAAAPVAAPAIAKATVEQDAFQFSGLKAGRHAGFLSAGSPSPDFGIMNGIDPLTEAAKYIGKHGIPDFKLQEIREEALRVIVIDPQIIALRSVSFGHKVNMQQRLNYEHQVRRLTHWLSSAGQARRTAREAFYKLTGWHL